jgi:hypothetical protein
MNNISKYLCVSAMQIGLFFTSNSYAKSAFDGAVDGYNQGRSNRINAERAYIDAYINGVNARNAINQELRNQAPQTQPAVDQAQIANLAAATSKCLVEKAPKGWQKAYAIVDRKDPKNLVVSAEVEMKDSKDPVRVDVCDVRTQANLVLAFLPLIPADQQNWQKLIYTVDNQGAFNVFTDVGFAKSQ